MKKKATCVTSPKGTKYWYLGGKLHREDGPAYEGVNGTKAWYLNSKRHREDGPAYEGVNGTKEWWLNGIEYTEQQYWQELYKRGRITKDKAFLELV